MSMTFLSLVDGKAIPYGVYDLVHNQGFVNVGLDHDTAEFAVESIRRWWQRSGKAFLSRQKSICSSPPMEVGLMG